MVRTYKASTALMLAIVMVLSMPLAAFAELPDIQGHWAENMISSTVENGLLEGYPDGTFRPEEPMTQAEFFTIINRSFGFGRAEDLSMPAISSGAWYAAELLKAKAQGYLDILGEGVLMPDRPISREMAAAILGKVMRLEPDDAIVNDFSDAAGFTPWAKGMSGAAVGHGYMQGYSDDTFKPDKHISRAEVSTIMYRVVGKLYKDPGVYGEGQITTIKGNATVSGPNVILRNMVIEGDLYLTEGIGDGSITLENVTVKGTVIVGGGAGGIFMKDSAIVHMVVSTPGSLKGYVSAQGSTSIGPVKVYSEVMLEESGLSGAGFGDILIRAPKDSNIRLSGDFDRVEVASAATRLSMLKGTVKLLEINGTDTNVELDNSVKLGTLTVNKPAKITGNCTIGTANINSSNVTVMARPNKVIIAKGLTGVYCIAAAPVARSSGGGGGSGGGGSSGGGSGDEGLTIKSVGIIEAITVEYGTLKADIGLPDKAIVRLSDNSTKSLEVSWDNGTPDYNGDKVGTYEFSGTLALIDDIKNTDGLKAKVSVTVKKAEPEKIIVTGVETFSDINVEKGTEITVVEAVYLPEKAMIHLSDGPDLNVPVDWDGGTPAYDGNSEGVYTFIGMLEMPSEEVTNPDSYSARVRILVGDPVIENEVIKEVETLADISVAYGTDISEIDLPDTVGITLSNGDDTKTAGVVWDKSGYDGSTAGTYTLFGELKNLPEGVVNSGGSKARINITVNEPEAITVTGIALINDILAENGTDMENIELPAAVRITLSNGTNPEVSVTWDQGVPLYDGNTAGAYIFTGTLTLPGGVEATDLKASVNVIVADAIVTGVDAIADINVANGTAIEAVPLPETLGISLSNGLTATADIIWDTTSYDANTAGTYTMYGTLVNLPAGVVNSNGLKAEVRVIVGNATVASVAAIGDISVDNGTAAGNIGLPLTAAVTLGNGTTRDLAVAWDGGTPAYDGNTAGTYVFSGTLTVPAGVTETSLKASARVIVADAVIVSVNAISDINVAYGTALTAAGLPSKAAVVLSNGTTKELDVSWDGGTPTYDGNTAGTYVFSGTLTIPGGIAATDLMAAVNVIVSEAGPTGTYTIKTINFLTDGMSITVSNLSDANYFNVYRISNNALVNPAPVAINGMVSTLNAVYDDLSQLEIWVYSDSAGLNRVAVFTLSGDGTSGTLVLK